MLLLAAPKPTLIRLALAIVLHVCGVVPNSRNRQAAVHYTESIEIVATNPSVWANRAMCWLKLANPTKALADAEKCLELDPKYTKAHFRRGVALLELDRFVDACKAFRTTLDLDPKNAQAKSSMMLAEKKLSMLNR